MATVRLVHTYRYPAARVWAVATDYDCLKEAAKGLVRYEGLPSGPVIEGQVITTRVSLFGFMPAFDYTMEVLECDAERRVCRSHEYGGAVRAWDHTLIVEKTGRGCRLIDIIIIDAGGATWLYALWARFMYGRRHKPRLRMLA